MVKKAPTRRRDPEATRRRLLEAARTAFAARGFAGARLDTIAAAARANKALIRYHFGGKRGLYNAVLREDLLAAEQRLATLEADPGPAAERFGLLIETFAELYEARPEVPLILVRDQMDGAPNLDRETGEALFRFYAATRRLLEAGIVAGGLRQLDPHHVHLIVVGSLLYFRLTAPARAAYARRGMLPGPTLEWRDHVAIVRSILLHGLAGGDAATAPSTPRRTS